MAPMFGKLTPEQAEKLDRIVVAPADESKFGQQVLAAYLQQLKQSQTSISQQGKEVAYLEQLVKQLHRA